MNNINCALKFAEYPIRIGLSSSCPRGKFQMKLQILSIRPVLPRVLLRSMQKIKSTKTPTLPFSNSNTQHYTQLLQQTQRGKAMASLATLASVQPATIKGLGGSSLSGTKLSIKPSRQSLRTKNFR